jgi:hypothetical protein
MFPFTTENPNEELSFNVGDVIHVVSYGDQGEQSAWWQGFLLEDPNMVGWFPRSYVTMHDEKSPSSQEQIQSTSGLLYAMTTALC